MPRAPRPVADGLLYHALNRGNNRDDIFFAPEDYLTFLKALEQTQKRYPFRLFGYCLMTNHFHLLLSPEAGQSISRILQSVSVAHTWHYHKARGTVGHIWQGRFIPQCGVVVDEPSVIAWQWLFSPKKLIFVAGTSCVLSSKSFPPFRFFVGCQTSRSMTKSKFRPHLIEKSAKREFAAVVRV